MSTQSFFVKGRYLGSRIIPDNRLVPGLEVRRYPSIAAFCGRCGDIWLRLHHNGAEWTDCTTRPCAEHGDGQLTLPTDYGPAFPDYFSDDWPREAMRLYLIALCDHHLRVYGV